MIYNGFLLLVLVFTGLTTVFPVSGQDVALSNLRKNYAERYLQPDAHFALAKYYIDRDNLVQAFFILEYARRYRFSEKDFDKAYIAFFGDPMPEPPTEAKDFFETASKLATEQKYDEAEVYFQKAFQRYEKSFFINAWIGRFYFKARADSKRALPFYFRSYFLYPHAYETEYVESRIRTITIADAKASFASLKNGKSLSELIRHQNPLVVSMALEEMAKSWKPEYAASMLEAMSNDDSLVRWGAFVTLVKNAGGSLDRIVNDLLVDHDLRKRGLAAYAIVERPGKEKFQLLKKMLIDPVELIRFDAVSAIALSGGPEGKQILKAHYIVEKDPILRVLIERALSENK